LPPLNQLGGGFARVHLLAFGGGFAGRPKRCRGRRGGGRRYRLHDLQMRRAGNRGDGNDGDRNRLAVGADDHRHLHLLGVRPGIGRFKIDFRKDNGPAIKKVSPRS